jgi:ABC-type transport system involved in multi-copper enzyme maturation permease subunit
MKNVFSLLSLEFAKFRKSAVIGLLSILFAIMLPTVIFVGKEFKDVPPPLPSNEIFFNFPTVWDYLGYAGNWLVFFFLGLISVFIVVNEVSFKTFRQNIITGLTRRTYFLSKVYSIIAISLLATLYFMIIGFIIGVTHAEEFSFAEAFNDTSWAIPRFFLMTLGYTSFGLFCGFILRRSGIAVLFYLCYILMLEPILKWGVHYRYIKNESVNFYPMNSIEDLMPNPLFRFADLIPRKDIDFSFLLNYQQATISSIIWIVIFLAVAYYTFIKRDI